MRGSSRGAGRAAAAPARLIAGWVEADGAKKSGLAALTWTTICNFAVDASVAVALAGTLFFAAASGESRDRVALYLLVTIAPFAVIAPLIGPALDRIHKGRRLALSMTFSGRVLLAMWLMMGFHSWVLYPAALGMLVLSKSFGVLKSSMTPRVAPPTIDLVKVNARLTILGHIVGSMVAGGVAAAVSWLTEPRQALWLVVVLALVGMYCTVLIPPQAESGRQEISTSPVASTVVAPWSRAAIFRFPPSTRMCMWAVALSRIGTGFLTIFLAFAAKSTPGLSAAEQLNLLAIAGAAGGVGTFVGNFVGARVNLSSPRVTVLVLTATAVGMVVAAAMWPNLWLTALATGWMSISSALCKVSLDACIQDEIPERARSSAFGRSETCAQLAWVLGGTVAIICPSVLGTGFIVLAVIQALVFLRVVMVS